MKDQDLVQQLMATFLEELQVHVASLGQELMRLEGNVDEKERAASWETVFRSAHTLKGAAAVVHVDLIHRCCHCLEDVFEYYRDRHQTLPEQTASQLLNVVDAMEQAGAKLGSEQDLDDSLLAQKLPELEQLADQLKRGADGSAADEKEAGQSDEPTETESELADQASDCSDEDDFQLDQRFDQCDLATESCGAASPESNRVSTDDDGAGKSPASDQPAIDSVVSVDDPDRSAGRQATPELAPTIRVPAKKLDALLAHSGELLVARGRFSFRAEDVSAMRDAANDLHRTWRATESMLRQMTDVERDPLPIEESSDLVEPPVSDSKSSNAFLKPPLRTQRLVKVIDTTCSQLSAFSSRLDTLVSEMDADNRLLKQTCDRLDDEIYHVRMLPFSDACGGLMRAVRDIATSSGKKIKLEIVGSDVEVDRSILEGLRDPLLHLVRNAADHGVESSAERQRSDKPAMATITVSAALRGSQVQVEVADDGAGLDLERICGLARQREIEVPDDPREQVRLIFAPGFSTARMITDISGRGVGLDVVQNRVESLHGSVDVSFKPGHGTRFTVNVPLTLTTIRSMLVKDAGQTFAIPTSAIQSLVRFGKDDLAFSSGRPCLLTPNSPIPVASLAKTVGAEGPPRTARRGKQIAIVLCVGLQTAAVTVEEVCSEQEVLVKNLGPRVQRLRHFSGCTVLPDGQIALVMNAANVIRTALGRRIDSVATDWNTDRVKSAVASGGTILLAEDSPTTRSLLKGILETAGHRVSVAVDGQQAWEMVQASEFDLVVTDVDMPRMDGFELTQEIRQAESSMHMPVILVTARGTDRDKEHGITVGANAYITKDSFEQRRLLETIKQLI